MDRLYLELYDEYETESFGVVPFLKVKDLIKLKYRYETIAQMLSITTESLDLDPNINDFNIFFMMTEEGDVLEVEDIFTRKKHGVLDVFVDLLKVTFKTKDVNFINMGGKPVIKFKDYILHEGNYEELREVYLKSMCIQKSVKHTEGKRFEDEETRQRFEVYYQRKREKQIREMKKGSIENVIRIAKLNLNLFDNKESLRNMTLYDLINSYRNPMIKENYDKNFIAMWSGNMKNPKDVDMTHWTEKISTID